MSSGTSVPEPRTWRSIGPRFTVSIQTTARSTVGAAGFSRETPSEMPPTTITAAVAYAIAPDPLLPGLRGTSNINH